MQKRLIALLLTVVAIAWTLAALATWFDARHELDELLDSHLEQAASLVVAQQMHAIEEQSRSDGRGLREPRGTVAPRIGNHDDDDDDSRKKRKRERQDRRTDERDDSRERAGDHSRDEARRQVPRVAFQVFHEGRLLLRSPSAPADAMVAAGVEGFADASVDGRAWRIYAADAGHDLRIVVGERSRSRDAILGAVLRSTLLPMLVVLPLMGLALWWGVRRGLAPLGELRSQLAARDPQALAPVVLHDAPSELQPVTTALDALFARIATLLDGERRFTADAAHELRTPIAAIRAQAQVALQAKDAQVQRAALQRTLQGCDRAARLVDQLLQLARLEADAAVPSGTVDVAAVARRVVTDLASQALARSQALSFDAPDDPLVVRGDETLLAVMVRNLVDNAIRYAHEGGRIQVAATRRDGRARVEVHDDGPGMSDVERARLGERFYRAPGQDASGSGLGWSIVRRIARLHGLDLEVAAGEGGRGLRVSVAWP